MMTDYDGVALFATFLDIALISIWTAVVGNVSPTKPLLLGHVDVGGFRNICLV